MAEDRERVVETLIDDAGTITYRRSDGSILGYGSGESADPGGGGGFVEDGGRYQVTAPDNTVLTLVGSNPNGDIQLISGPNGSIGLESMMGMHLASSGYNPIWIRTQTPDGRTSEFQIHPDLFRFQIGEDGRFEIMDHTGTVLGTINEDGTTDGVFAGGAGGSDTIEAVHHIGSSGEPGWENGWRNYGPAYAKAGFYKDRDRVYLTGIIDGGISAESAFTLPVGYRPPETITVFGNDTDYTFYISLSGIVAPKLRNSPYGWSLEGVSFRV